MRYIAHNAYANIKSCQSDWKMIFPNEFRERNLILLIGLLEIENINYLLCRRDTCCSNNI